MQGCNQDYSIGKVEFIRTEKGFLYNQEHGDIAHASIPEYVLNCPVGTRIEMQGCNQDYSIGKVEFMRTEKGFLYNQEHGDADIEHVLAPEAWLNIGKRIFASSYKQSPKLFVVNTPNENTVKVAQWIREFTMDLELQRKRDIESLRQYICSISPNMLQPRIDDAETAG
ncbi:hypothetical protein TNCV_2406291 [Trichonephila clavipes]|nr:hypothetical protein TNCV_2406291 [Trichonephila clavipes]